MLKNIATGLYETHLNVTDLERSMTFYGEALGLELGAIFGKKGEARHMAFYWIGGRNRAMLGIWEREPVFSQHFAFRVDVENFKEAVAALKSKNIPLYNFYEEETEDPSVHGWAAQLSLYFSDPDGHSLELLAILPDDPNPDVGTVSWSEWERLHGR